MRRFLGKWPRRIAVLAVALAVCCYLAIRVWWSDGKEGPPPIQAPVSSSQARIAVGPNVHMSTAYASDRHFETVIAADPFQPQRLCAFAITPAR